MPSIKRILGIAIFCSTLVALPAKAWGPSGHAAVALIAAANLDPKTAAQVLALLRQEDPKATLPATFDPASVWADQIKASSQWAFTKSWHFADWSPNFGPDYLDNAIQKDGDVVQALVKFEDTLRGTFTDPRWNKTQALKFLLHFTGDIHQPLHAGRDSDRGGNDITVTLGGKSSSLHGVWDSLIIDRLLSESAAGSGGSPAQHLADLAEAQWKADLQSGAVDPHWDQATYADWLDETHALAMKVAYFDPNGQEVKSNQALSDAYYQAAKLVVLRQIALGGHRLANTLDAIELGTPLTDAQTQMRVKIKQLLNQNAVSRSELGILGQCSSVFTDLVRRQRNRNRL